MTFLLVLLGIFLFFAIFGKLISRLLLQWVTKMMMKRVQKQMGFSPKDFTQQENQHKTKSNTKNTSKKKEDILGEYVDFEEFKYK